MLTDKEIDVRISFPSLWDSDIRGDLIVDAKLREAQRNFTLFSETLLELSEISALRASEFISSGVELIHHFFNEAFGDELVGIVFRNAAGLQVEELFFIHGAGGAAVGAADLVGQNFQAG